MLTSMKLPRNIVDECGILREVDVVICYRRSWRKVIWYTNIYEEMGYCCMSKYRQYADMELKSAIGLKDRYVDTKGFFLYSERKNKRGILYEKKCYFCIALAIAIF